MLYLHGSGARGDDNQAQLEGMQFNVRQNPERYNFIMVFPQCRPEAFWAGEKLVQAMAALEQTVKEFNGDPNRLYLAGCSMGGFGTWQAAVAYPNKFAAFVPIAGGIKPRDRCRKNRWRCLLRPSAVPPNPTIRTKPSPKRSATRRSGYSTAEPTTSSRPEGSRQMVATLKANGNLNVRYTEFENVGHGRSPTLSTNRNYSIGYRNSICPVDRTLARIRAGRVLQQS